MAKDLKIYLEDKPGSIALIGETLGKAGVNIDGVCGFARDVKSGEDRELVTHTIHILVQDAVAARNALKTIGVRVEEERDVVIPTVPDQPGEIGRVCRRLADAGVNIDFFYTITNTRFVLGVDDIKKALNLL
jgi:hypothetical protein